MIALSINDDGSHRIASHEMWKLERHVEMVQYVPTSTYWELSEW